MNNQIQIKSRFFVDWNINWTYLQSIFCGSCFDADFASKCEGCGEWGWTIFLSQHFLLFFYHIFYIFFIFRWYFCPLLEKPFVCGTKKVEYKCRQWHDTCFHCKVCKTKVIRIDEDALLRTWVRFDIISMKLFTKLNSEDVLERW